jgi:alpha/beta superfamily hydrolase
MEKKIDAVAITRRIRDAHHEQLKDATAAERIHFFREKARRVHAAIDEQPTTRAQRSKPV